MPAPKALCDVDSNDPNAVAPGAKPFPGQNPAGARNQDISGNPLPDAPRNKIALSAAYTWHFDPGNLTFAGSYSWRDTQDGTVFNRSYDNAPSWSDVDLRLLWVGHNDRYEIIGSVKNLFDTIQYTVGSAGQGLLGNATTATTAAAGLFEQNNYNINPPRTFSVEVRYKFF